MRLAGGWRATEAKESWMNDRQGTASLRLKWRPPALVLALLSAAAILVPMARSASADPNPAPDDTWGTNGIVYAILPVGNTIYVGGHFTSVGPDGTGTPRANLAAFDATTGVATSWNPGTNKSVYALEASEDGSIIYVGGSFTQIGGLFRNRMAAVDAASGIALPGFRANTNKPVWDLLLHGTRLYVAGDFTLISLNEQDFIAVVDPDSGDFDASWTPDVTGQADKGRIRTMALSSDNARLYFGGRIIAVDGVTRLMSAAVHPETAELDPWDPALNYKVQGLFVTSTRVYVAGAPGPRPGGETASVDPVSGFVYWRKQADGDVNAVGVLGTRVYAGGHFVFLQGGILRKRIVAYDADTGALDPWFPGTNGEVWAISIVDNHIYVGGGFTTIGGVLQPGFARFTDPEE
jgi:hypothetical protein